MKEHERHAKTIVELRAQHPNVLLCPADCRACSTGIPYPELTIDEIREALAKGHREAEEAYPVLFGRGTPQYRYCLDALGDTHELRHSIGATLG